MSMKNNKFLWIFLPLAISTFVLPLVARAAQDQALEITEVTYKSEDGTVASKLYKSKDLRGRAPAILVLPGRGRDFSGMEWLIKPLAQNGYAVLAIGYRGVPVAPGSYSGCRTLFRTRLRRIPL
jgi:alpha-beta hydrolase superfamily lysophospholipase